MRTFLRIAALLLALGVTAFWFFGGPNPGWTKNSVTHMVKDPVTEIEGPVYEKRFVPGIDFLGGGLLASAVLAGASFCFRDRRGGKMS
jgi:hypothetical protein